MSEEDNIFIAQEEFDKLTPNQKASHINSLKSHKGLAIEKLNKIIKDLAYFNESTDIEIHTINDTKTQKKIDRDSKVYNFPKTVKGPTYYQVFDKTDIPKKK